MDDPIVEEIRATAAILEYARQRQLTMGRRVISRGELEKKAVNPTEVL